MHPIRTLTIGATHQLYRGLLVACGRATSVDERVEERAERHLERDRGAVSLEQVLWFVAAGVSVAVIASILWRQIRDEAERPVDSPSSP